MFPDFSSQDPDGTVEEMPPKKVHKTFPLHVFTEKFDSASFLNFERYIQDGKKKKKKKDGKHCRKCFILKTHYYRICDFIKCNLKKSKLLQFKYLRTARLNNSIFK